jgi:predicted molibdopterin-dependent oxidoreductase YjgC
LKPADAVYRGNHKIENKYPDLTYNGCQLCIVEIEGKKGFHRACNTSVEEGMIIHSDTEEVKEFRRNRLMFILTKHPHVCLTCMQRKGCALVPCSMNIPENCRCCSQFNHCELQKLSEYVGIKKETPRYIFEDLPVINNEPLLEWNFNLCIGCSRCIRACKEIAGAMTLDFIFDSESRVLVGTIGPGLKKSGCRFCGSCAAVCPTGAIQVKNRLKELEQYSTPVMPPEEKPWADFTTKYVETVPEVEGVYQLFDEQKNIIYIKGAINLQHELKERLESNENARYFNYEIEPFYTKKESELLQRHIAEYGEMPEGNRELDDLF